MSALSPLSDKHLAIFGGPFGSGKTEVAINYALLSAASGRPTAIADLDIVNPYFRTSGQRARLEQAGIRVVAPSSRLAQFDAPALPGEITGLLRDAAWSIFDVGGDPVGTAVLAGLVSQIAEKEYDFWIVVNQRRPQTRTRDDIIARVQEIEAAARLTVTGLVSNTHLSEQTIVEHMLTGHQLIEQAATQLRLPVAFAAVPASLVGQASWKVPILPIVRRLRVPWEEEH